MQDPTFVIEALKELPLSERTVAVALKSVFDQIKKLMREESLEIQANHVKFTQKFQLLQSKNAAIIKGGAIQSIDPVHFTPIQQAEANKFLHKSRQPLQDFWLRACSDYFNQHFTAYDKNFMKHCVGITSKVTLDIIELNFEMKSSDVAQEGVYSRRLILKEGIPTTCQGNHLECGQGVIKQLFIDGPLNDNPTSALKCFNDFLNGVIPSGLQHYLGTTDLDQQDQQDEDQDQEDDSDSQQQ